MTQAQAVTLVPAPVCRRLALSLPGLIAAFMLVACGPSPEQVAREKAKQELEAAAKRLEEANKKMEAAAGKGAADAAAAAGEAMKALGAMVGAAVGAAGGGQFEPVDFRKLREVLPLELSGLNKGESSGEKTNAFGISVSQASQKFVSADGKQRVKIEVTDPGTLGGPFALAHAWLSIEVDKETGDGHEKTTTLNGRRVHERWRKSDQSAEIQAVVGGRFLVEIETRGLPINEVRALLNRIDLTKLEAMKAEGKKS